MQPTRRSFLQAVAASAAASQLAPSLPASAAEKSGFTAEWPAGERVWVGPDFWANRLQDWRVRDGRLECAVAAGKLPMRTVHLLTRRLGPGKGDFQVSVHTGATRADEVNADAATGFLIGAGHAGMEPRAAALIHHNPGPRGGLFCGVDAAGKPFIRSFESPRRPGKKKPPAKLSAEIQLRLTATGGADGYTLVLSAHDITRGRPIGRVTRKNVDPKLLVGNVALVSHPGTGPDPAGFWYRDWAVFGEKFEHHPERALGPILCTQYTVHEGVLKLTAQMAPVGEKDNQTAALQIKKGEDWETVATTRIVVPGYTAPFRVEKWDASRAVPYHVVYHLDTHDKEPFTWAGTIQKDPADRDEMVLAALSCVEQVRGGVDRGRSYRWDKTVWFPHADMVPNVARHKPDLYFFAGDQIYEGNPTRPVRGPGVDSQLDYLYKWYLWCWAYRELVRDVPTVCIPDDHDVYLPNVWGDGGRPARAGDPGGHEGGYGQPPEWLNMIQRTQTSHLPDAVDPRPVRQDIGVYFTALTWGKVGFAILEDRKFKSSPTLVKAAKTLDSHITEKDFDTHKADVPGATLLGERQLKFLREFAADWRGQEMKAALSQTIFCNLQISSRPPTTGELDKDLDSNGWPQAGRNRALRELRKGFAVHIAGDQHLPSALQHGIDEHEDAVWSLCVPAVANLYTRFWNPSYPPLGKPGKQPFSGRYEDGFHNKITVHAVANPVEKPRPGQFPEPVELHRKGTGYSIVRFDKKRRTITLEVWPRFVDPSDPKTGGQYAGWPITVRQEDNDGRKPAAWLPELRIRGMRNPVVRVLDGKDGGLLYTLRIKGTTYRPKVFAAGTYTVEVGEPGTPRFKTVEGVATVKEGETKRIEIAL